jgi:histone-binding protein RBBP4
MLRDLSLNNVVNSKRARRDDGAAAGAAAGGGGAGPGAGPGAAGAGAAGAAAAGDAGGRGKGVRRGSAVAASEPASGLLGGEGSGVPAEDFAAWKRNLAVLYDSLIYHNLSWGSLSCAFGRDVAAPARDFSRRHTMYYATRTDASFDVGENRWNRGQPGHLLWCSVDVGEANCSNRKYIARFMDTHKSSKVQVIKSLVHPGEVNRLRVSPLLSNVVATHSDSPHVFVWDMSRQPDRGGRGAPGAARADGDESGDSADEGEGGKQQQQPQQQQQLPPLERVANVPELTLTGHTAVAEYALEFAPTTNHVLSGGSDHRLLLWNLDASQCGFVAASEPRQPVAEGPVQQSTLLPPVTVFVGHTGTIEACSFNPLEQGRVCASSGHDQTVLFWDSRAGTAPTHRVRGAHRDDINCCAWNPLDANYFCSGGDDEQVCVFDVRKLGAPATPSGGLPAAVVRRFQAHRSPVINLKWSPHRRDLLATTGQEACLNLWSLGDALTEPELFFKHAGHRIAVSDFDWSKTEPWLFMSVSDEGPATSGGGGSLQVWRISDFLTRAKDPELVSVLKKALAKAQQAELAKIDATRAAQLDLEHDQQQPQEQQQQQQPSPQLLLSHNEQPTETT